MNLQNNLKLKVIGKSQSLFSLLLKKLFTVNYMVWNKVFNKGEIIEMNKAEV